MTTPLFPDRTFYEILRADRKDGGDTLRRAWFRRLRDTDPTRHPEHSSAEADIYRTIWRAGWVLGDRMRRERYDALVDEGGHGYAMRELAPATRLDTILPWQALVVRAALEATEGTGDVDGAATWTAWIRELDLAGAKFLLPRLLAGLAGFDLARRFDRLREACAEELRDLPAARVVWLWQLKGTRRRGKVVGGTARKLSDRERARWPGGPAEAPWFEVTLALDAWIAAPEAGRFPLLHHELMHCGVDDDGRPFLRPHDAEVFAATLARFGAWQDDRARLVAAANAHPHAPAQTDRFGQLHLPLTPALTPLTSSAA